MDALFLKGRPASLQAELRLVRRARIRDDPRVLNICQNVSVPPRGGSLHDIVVGDDGNDRSSTQCRLEEDGRRGMHEMALSRKMSENAKRPLRQLFRYNVR